MSDGGSDKKLLECAGCLSSYFCNIKCQQRSWPLHKKVCRQRKTSVVKIQSNWRGWYTRRHLELNDGQDRCEVCGRLDSKDKQLSICNGCKLSLFCSVRCQEYAWKKKNHKIICQKRHMAAMKIQAAWASIKCAKKLQEKTRQRAALKIQSAWIKAKYVKSTMKIQSYKQDKLERDSIIMLIVVGMVGCIISIVSRFTILVSFMASFNLCSFFTTNEISP